MINIVNTYAHKIIQIRPIRANEKLLFVNKCVVKLPPLFLKG